jgi:hypothetical protein
MSLAGKRAAFAAALSTVDGVAGYAERPAAPRAGDAWPVWRGAERDEDSGLLGHTWAVGVYLPQDRGSADDWIDGHVDALIAALRPVAYVDGFDPANFGTDNSPVFGLLLTTRSE